MRIVLLGKIGQLGWELQRTLHPLGPLLALDYPEIDLLSPDPLVARLLDFAPQIIINATAYTAVDQAESELERAMAINAHAPGLLAELAKDTGALLIHYSTDYVFDGSKGHPQVSDEGLEIGLPPDMNPLPSPDGIRLRAGAQMPDHSEFLRSIVVSSWRRYSGRFEAILTARVAGLPPANESDATFTRQRFQPFFSGIPSKVSNCR